MAVRRALDHIKYSGRMVKTKIQVGTEFLERVKCQGYQLNGTRGRRKNGGRKMATIKLGYAPTRRSIFSAPDAIKYRGLTAERLKELGIEFVDIDDINKEGLLR